MTAKAWHGMSEEDFVIYERSRVEAADQWFGVRAEFDPGWPASMIFDGGFRKGWQAALCAAMELKQKEQAQIAKGTQ